MTRRFTLIMTVVCALFPISALAHWTLVEEHWYTIEIAGGRAGHARERIERHDDDRRIRMTIDTAMRMGRLGADVSIAVASISVETVDGEPIRFESSSTLSQQSKSTICVFDDETITITHIDGPRERTSERPVPAGDWLMPFESRTFIKARLDADAERIEYRTLSAEGGVEPIEVTMTKVSEGRMDVNGRELPVTTWSLTSSDLPGIPMTAIYSADGIVIEQAMNLPVGTMVSRLTTRDEALARGGPAPELMAPSFVELEKPIRNLEERRAITFEVIARDGTLPALPNAGVQRVEMSDDKRRATVQVDLDAPQAATDEERDNAVWLGASTMIDREDPMIIALMRKATRRAGESPMERALAMRTFVDRHISQKDFDTAFASASECAKMRTGDCSEHAVLLAALLRADDIPARVADGLVYVDGYGESGQVFGWHMWTQALIDGVWVDLDATLSTPYHVGHILTNTSSMADNDTGENFSSMLRLLGNIDIRVVEPPVD